MTGLKLAAAGVVLGTAGLVGTQVQPVIDPTAFSAWERVGIITVLAIAVTFLVSVLVWTYRWLIIGRMLPLLEKLNTNIELDTKSREQFAEVVRKCQR